MQICLLCSEYRLLFPRLLKKTIVLVFILLLHTINESCSQEGSPIQVREFRIELDDTQLPGPDENWMNFACQFCEQFHDTPERFEAICINSLIEFFISKGQEELSRLINEQLVLLEQAHENQKKIVKMSTDLVFSHEITSLKEVAESLVNSKRLNAQALENFLPHNPPGRSWTEFETFVSERIPDGTLVKARLPDKYTPFFIHTHSPTKCRYLSLDLIIRGMWDPVKTDRILQLMEQGRSVNPQGVQFLDLGAHLGWFTLAVAAQGHAVLAVEPMPRNYEKLVKSIEEANQLDGTVYLHTEAVSDVARDSVCIEPLQVAEENYGNGQLQLEDDSSCAEAVETVPLDEMLKAYNGLNIWVMKLDLEGHEPNALRGAKALFDSKHAPCYVLSEFNEELSVQQSSKESIYHDLFEIMAVDYGYSVYLEGSSTQINIGNLLKAGNNYFGSEYEFRREFDARCFTEQ